MNYNPSPAIQTAGGHTKPSLRARQKEARKKRMLEAARTLFVANSYGKTSIESIAEAAEVGVATVYAYFESKEGLAATLIRHDVNQILDEIAEVSETLPDDPAEALIQVMGVLVDFNRFISAELLREFVEESRIDGPVGEVWDWNHENQIDAIVKILVRGQKMGRVASTLDVDTAAAIIIDLLDRHLHKLTTARNTTAVNGQLEKFVRLLFTEWT